MTLYLKYRPTCLEDIVGNCSTVEALKSLSRMPLESLPHSYLFSGPTGCGKTTLARILAKNILQCSDFDFQELDVADFRGIETIRDIRRTMTLKPLKGKTRVWLLDECHKLTNDAQNAMLKALEDTPSHVYFILSTTEPNKLIPTIVNRCLRFQVHKLSRREMIKLLKRIAKLEYNSKIEIHLLSEIASTSEGSARKALTTLEKVMALNDPESMLKAIREEQFNENKSVIDLCRALYHPQANWENVRKVLLDLENEDHEKIRKAVLGYFANVLMSKHDMLAHLIIQLFKEPFYDSGFPGIVSACFEVFAQSKEVMKHDNSDVPY